MTKVRKSTMVELVEELRKLPQTDGIELMIKEALAGEYHDFNNNKYNCEKVQSSGMLREFGHIELAKRIEGGEFEEEADFADRVMMDKILTDSLKNRKPNTVATNAEGFAPRLRGKAYQEGKSWYFFINITIGADSDDNPGITMNFNEKSYLSEEAAVAGLKAEVPKVMEKICKGMGIEHAGYMDLKENKFRKTL